MGQARKDPWRLGIIGCGGFSRFGLEAVAAMDEVTVTALADPVAANRELAAATWRQARRAAGRPPSEPALYADHRALLEQAAVDIVWVLTPPHLHHPVARDALLAGKHLFVEKPGSLRWEEMDELLSLAEDRGVRAGIDFVMRHNPLYRWLKELIASGVLGPLEHIAVENVACDDQLPPEHWFWDTERSGGIWVEHGVHFFDLIQWLAGPAANVTALSGRRPLPGGREPLRDAVSALTRHPQPAPQPPVLASHYHAFTHPKPFERTRLRLVLQRAYLEVAGWIAVDLRGEALLEGEIPRLEKAHWLTLSTVETYDGPQQTFSGRGKTFTARRRVRLEGRLGDRQEVYRESIRAGLKDLLRAATDPTYQPAVDLRAAQVALQTALAATTVQQSVPCLLDNDPFSPKY